MIDTPQTPDGIDIDDDARERAAQDFMTAMVMMGAGDEIDNEQMRTMVENIINQYEMYRHADGEKRDLL